MQGGWVLLFLFILLLIIFLILLLLLIFLFRVRSCGSRVEREEHPHNHERSTRPFTRPVFLRAFYLVREAALLTLSVISLLFGSTAISWVAV